MKRLLTLGLFLASTIFAFATPAQTWYGSFPAHTGGGGGGTVTFDNATSSSTQTAVGVSSMTYSYTVGSGLTDGYLVVMVGTNTTNTVTCTGVTYNGTAMTLLGGPIEPDSQASEGYIYMWGLAAPTAGANNVVVTLSGAVDAAGTIISGAASYSHVSSTAHGANANGNSATASITVTSQTNDMVVGYFGSGSDISPLLAGTSRFTDTFSSSHSGIGNDACSDIAGGASVTTDWTIVAGGDWWAAIGIDLVHD